MFDENRFSKNDVLMRVQTVTFSSYMSWAHDDQFTRDCFT